MAGTLAWERIGNQFFRSLDGPPMRWGLQIAHHHVSAGICGGVIAVWDRDDIVRHHRADASTSFKPLLRLFDAEGIQVGSIVLDFGSVLDVLVTISETIVVVTHSGLVRHYSDFGRNFVQMRLPFEVSHCFLIKNGYMARAVHPYSPEKILELAMVTTVPNSGADGTEAEPRYHLLSLEANESSGSIAAVAFIPGDKSIGRVNHILTVTTEGTAYIYDAELSYLSQRQVAQNVASKLVIVSPTGNCVAFSDGENLKVFRTDFHDQAYEGRSLPRHHDLKWIGDEALALVSQDGEADIFGLADQSSRLSTPSAAGGASSGSSLTTTTYFEEGEVALISEVDSLRVLSKHHHGLYVPVYQPTVDTFKLGSVTPSAILYSCVDQMDVGSPRSDQTAKMLEQHLLIRAVETCISASQLEIEPKIQKRLLRAAAFGKSIADAYDSSRYVDALPKLRIGNALRNLHTHPLFITQRQLSALGTTAVLKRLEYRKLWAEAVSVAEIEKMPSESVYIEWACDMILANDDMNDEELFAVLEAKMKKLGAFSHSKMAIRAIEQGRQTLASTLLESEPVAADRVRLSLEMGMTQKALEQAMWSGNSYLVDYVLLILTEQLSMPQLMRIIGTNKMAIERQKVLVQLKENPTQQLHDFLYHMDLRKFSLQVEYDNVCQELAEATTTAAVDKQIQNLRALEKKFGALNQKMQPDATASAEWADLLSLQKQLEIDYNVKFVGVSASETISILLKLPQISQAQKLRTKLGISERQFWWLRLRALVDRREFDLVWELGQSKKSPIGYQPFFDVCFEAGNYETAAKFVDLISEASLEDKVKMLVKMKHTDAARTLAAKSKDTQLIAMLNAM